MWLPADPAVEAKADGGTVETHLLHSAAVGLTVRDGVAGMEIRLRRRRTNGVGVEKWESYTSRAATIPQVLNDLCALGVERGVSVAAGFGPDLETRPRRVQCDSYRAVTGRVQQTGVFMERAEYEFAVKGGKPLRCLSLCLRCKKKKELKVSGGVR